MSSGQRIIRPPAPRSSHAYLAANPKSGAGLALLLTAILSGCATPNSNPYPYFERLAIQSRPPLSGEETDAAVASTAKMIVGGAAAGASGALVTGLLTSLACGPYFAVCFAGTGVAALGGATVGAVAGGSIALSAEEAEMVTEHLENLQSEHSLSEDLADSVSTRLPAERLSVPDTADAHLFLVVEGLRLHERATDQLIVALRRSGMILP